MSTRKGGRGGVTTKKTSGEEKKAKRLEHATKAKALKELVDTAHQVEDYLSIFQPFRTYEKTTMTTKTTNDGDSNGSEQFKVYLKDFSPSVFTSSSAAPSILQWMFDITKRHMQPHYEKSKGGWSDGKKRSELRHERARFLIAFEKEDSLESPVGFIHYRFEEEEDTPVLYCYEVQVEDKAQRKGLGRRLMQLLELIARRAQMRQLLLTVQLSNVEAHRFYTDNLKYSRYQYSPMVVDPLHAEEYGYDILTKVFPAPTK